MTTYPGAIDELKRAENIPGIQYNAEDKKTVYAEDTNDRIDAIIAVQTTLGVEPAGAFETVVDRLNASDAALGTKEDSIGYTPENAANKSTATSLGASDTLYPTQKAVKAYVDTGLSTKQNSLGYTAEDSANKSTSTSLGTSNTLYPSQNAVKAYVDVAISAAKQALYPVGSIWTSTSVSTNPGTVLGFGTWSAFGQGRVLVSKATSGTFGTAGATGGAETHTLTLSEIPSHNHGYDVASNNANGLAALGRNGSDRSTVATSFAGGGGSHNNLQPYIVVYMWERTA